MAKLTRALTAASFVAVCLAVHMPAFADDYDRSDGRASTSISRAEATAIAREHGMGHISEVERDDDGWEIEGRHRDGRKMEIEISRSGHVQEIDYD
jgi:uncharacterized membrane protein YkoI